MCTLFFIVGWPRLIVADSEELRQAAADDEAGGLLVIGAGFGRTGTTSTRAALEQLGFGKTHHMVEVVENLQLAIWGDIAYASTTEERRALLREALADYRSTVDLAACYYKDLLVMYPDAKVLLTTRSPESWYKSAWSTILTHKRYASLSADTLSSWRGVGNYLFNTLTPWGWEFARVLHGPLSLLADAHSPEDYMAAFKAWEAEVEATVPPERLLKFNVVEGWGPLAAFLGVPVPDGPFPNVNDSAEFQNWSAFLALIGYAAVVLYAAVFCTLCRVAAAASSLTRQNKED